MPPLLQPINIRIVLRYLIILLFPLGIASFIPFVYALFLRDWFLAFSFFMVFMILFPSGFILIRFIPERSFGFGEGLSIVAISYPIASLIAALPLVFGGNMPWIDACFETISGFTTTGFTMVKPENLPQPLILWRAITQWIGGMGFVILYIGFIISPGSPISKLFSPQTEEERLPLPLNKLASVILKVYIIFTLIGILCLLLAGLSLFDALCFTFSTISTGGFAPYSSSAGYFSSLSVHIILISLMIIGALNFTLFYKIIYLKQGLRRRLMTLITNPQLIALFFIILVAFIILKASLGIDTVPLIFTIISAQTNTGLSLNLPINPLPKLLSLLIPLMFIGGSIASTTGGIKLFRLIVALKILHRIIMKPMLPKEIVLPCIYKGEHLREEEIKTILLLIITQ
ncbi:MAG: TrkH family potassium uptake protein, partial [Nitrospirae bacterium]